MNSSDIVYKFVQFKYHSYNKIINLYVNINNKLMIYYLNKYCSILNYFVCCKHIVELNNKAIDIFIENNNDRFIREVFTDEFVNSITDENGVYLKKISKDFSIYCIYEHISNYLIHGEKLSDYDNYDIYNNHDNNDNNHNIM